MTGIHTQWSVYYSVSQGKGDTLKWWFSAQKSKQKIFRWLHKSIHSSVNLLLTSGIGADFEKPTDVRTAVTQVLKKKKKKKNTSHLRSWNGIFAWKYIFIFNLQPLSEDLLVTHSSGMLHRPYFTFWTTDWWRLQLWDRVPCRGLDFLQTSSEEVRESCSLSDHLNLKIVKSYYRFLCVMMPKRFFLHQF